MKNRKPIQQALAKAREKWGATAVVEERPKPTMHNDIQLSGRFCVGRVVLGLFFEVKGDGDSWDAAFADAEHREQTERDRMAKLRAEREQLK